MENCNVAEKEVLSLLIDMFPYLKQYFTDIYNASNGLGDLKYIISDINNYLFLRPTVFNYWDIKFLEYDSYIKRDEKYSLFVKSKIDKFFRNSYTHPKNLNLLSCTPITIDENNIVIEGKHRAYVAKKFMKPIKAVKVIKAKNSHKNVEAINNLSKHIKW